MFAAGGTKLQKKRDAYMRTSERKPPNFRDAKGPVRFIPLDTLNSYLFGRVTSERRHFSSVNYGNNLDSVNDKTVRRSYKTGADIFRLLFLRINLVSFEE